jgi:putative ABC transport system permease protein
VIRPPRLPARLLAWVFRDDPAAPAILGDLHEDYIRMGQTRGRSAAGLRYWREALGLAASRLAHARARAVRSASIGFVGTVREDAGYAARMLRRSPGFFLFTAAIIGVGVGAATTVFSVLEPLAFDPPFEDAHQLVWIQNEGEAGDGSLSAITMRTVNLIDFRERTTSFSGITGYDAFFSGRSWALTGVGEPERITAVGVAHDFLDVLRVQPLFGRGFAEEEGRRGGPPAMILSHDYWRTRFAGDPSVVGRTLRLNGVPRTVVGVLPPTFDFSSTFVPTVEVNALVPFVVSEDNAYQGNVLSLIGRMKPGVGVEAAQAELSALVEALGREDPARWGLGAEVMTLQDHLAGPFRHSLLLVAAAAATLLLIACLNVSSLLLARLPARATEMAVRKAFGASRSRLVRQLVLETLGIAVVGAAIGSGIAWVATRAVRNATGIRIPLLDAVQVDGSALAVAAGLAALTGIVVGAIPALRASEGSEADALRSGARGSSAGPGAGRLREGLVVAEVALACTLLVVGGLLTASFQAVLAVDLGFEPAGTVAWSLHPSPEFASHAEKVGFYERLVERVEAVPGVEAAALADALPLGRNRAWSFDVVGVAEEEDSGEEAFPHVVDPGYLPLMGIRLAAGRNFTAADHADALPVVLLNETAARRIFGGEREAIGGRLKFWGRWVWEVVGVVQDVRHISPEMGAGIEVYFPFAQMPDFGTGELVVRSSLPRDRVAPAVSAALAEIDPGMPARGNWSLQARVRDALSERRFALAILTAFGAAALLLAALGIYGVLARTVAERRAEIGIRMALGASGRVIVRDVLRRMLLLTALGIATGWALSLVASGLLESLLFGVRRAEPVAFAATTLVLLAVAALAAALPARRAVATDVGEVLKAK